MQIHDRGFQSFLCNCCPLQSTMPHDLRGTATAATLPSGRGVHSTVPWFPQSLLCILI